MNIAWKALGLALVVGLAGCAGEEAKPSVTTTGSGSTITGSTRGNVDAREVFAQQVGDRVYFAYDQTDLSSEARRTLDRQAAWLKQNSQYSIVIEGHADERGTREYNLALGDRRANSVQQYLVAQGIPAARVTTLSYGKDRPVAVGSSEAAWAQNRRGVTVLK